MTMAVARPLSVEWGPPDSGAFGERCTLPVGGVQ
jgi:hypothetical protein